MGESCGIGEAASPGERKGTPVVLLVCPDLMFASRIQTIGRHAGIAVKNVRLSGPLPDGDLLVVSHAGGEGWEAAIREAAEKGIPAIAFGPHVDAEGRGRAKAAGAMRVVANGNVDRALAPVFQELAATGRMTGSDLPNLPEMDEADAAHEH